jgi:hypothetical protein
MAVALSCGIGAGMGGACVSPRRRRSRAKTADELWPEFERRLKDLGYSARGIARAFSVLGGPGTVDEALHVLESR